MSLTAFLAFCILGCDFMLVVLFQWLYGEKHRGHTARRGGKHAPASQSPLYYVHAKRVSQPDPSPSNPAVKLGASNPKKSASPASRLRREEELAHQRIVSFARPVAASNR